MIEEHEEGSLHNRRASTSSNINKDETEIDDVEKMLRELEKKRRCQDNSTPSINILNMLQSFSKYPRLDSKQNILEF